MSKRTQLWGYLLVVVLSGCNPFAPEFDESIDESSSLLSDACTYEGIFENIKYAYTFRDTTVYSKLLAGNFTFCYTDYDRAMEVSWGRDEEMRITYQLFQNVQRLDVVWNQIKDISVDSANTAMNITRSFTLTVTFNPSDVIRAEGYASLQLSRTTNTEPWKIVLWRDESNY
ncbi:MAG: hypothetical protein KBG83_07335 [Bacteroidetes bacterium]|jgi:hypothetical protein|nr:hypothetical protein [Bacteroidota bacterium]